MPGNFAARGPGVDAGAAGGSATRAKPLLGFARVFFLRVRARAWLAHARAAIRKAVRPAIRQPDRLHDCAAVARCWDCVLLQTRWSLPWHCGDSFPVFVREYEPRLAMDSDMQLRSVFAVLVEQH